MRAAGALFVATMLSTSIVSGTYAKYVTTGSVTDSARVAKFGVTIDANGSLFDTTYYSADDGNGISAENGTITVQSNEKVVAPGTTNSTGLNFGISGTPEVKVKVEIGMEADKDIFLAPGTYTDVTGAGATFDLDEKYSPIKWTLSKGDAKLVENGTVQKVNEELKKLSLTFAPGTDLAKAEGLSGYTLTWNWDFDDAAKGTNDKADTVLGDLAAAKPTVQKFESGTGSALTDDDYSTGIDVKFTITVTQVD